jgi:hypothetical protein
MEDGRWEYMKARYFAKGHLAMTDSKGEFGLLPSNVAKDAARKDSTCRLRAALTDGTTIEVGCIDGQWVVTSGLDE